MGNYSQAAKKLCSDTIELEMSVRQVRNPAIKVECIRCDRQGELDRKKLVRLYGADLTFRHLRRRLAIGCDRIDDNATGARCELNFRVLAGDVTT